MLLLQRLRQPQLNETVQSSRVHISVALNGKRFNDPVAVMEFNLRNPPSNDMSEPLTYISTIIPCVTCTYSGMTMLSKLGFNLTQQPRGPTQIPPWFKPN